MFEETRIELPARCAAKYRPGRLLGRGGFGAVFLCEQVKLQRPVAVKVLSARMAERPDMVARFVNEAKITASLKHPHIVVVIDFGVDEDVPWIVYEYIDGWSLRQRIKKETLDWPTAFLLAGQIAWALEEAHTHGVLHRDIKPDNVMEAAPNRVKVLDFGLAKWSEDSAIRTRTGKIIGTPSYLAPEIIEGGEATAAADIYALGNLLYELIAGRTPHHAERPEQVLISHLRDPVPPLGEAGIQIPPGAESVILKALEKEPASRFGSARELRLALEGAAGAFTLTGDGFPGARRRLDTAQGPGEPAAKAGRAAGSGAAESPGAVAGAGAAPDHGPVAGTGAAAGRAPATPRGTSAGKVSAGGTRAPRESPGARPVGTPAGAPPRETGEEPGGGTVGHAPLAWRARPPAVATIGGVAMLVLVAVVMQGRTVPQPPPLQATATATGSPRDAGAEPPVSASGTWAGAGKSETPDPARQRIDRILQERSRGILDGWGKMGALRDAIWQDAEVEDSRKTARTILDGQKGVAEELSALARGLRDTHATGAPATLLDDAAVARLDAYAFASWSLAAAAKFVSSPWFQELGDKGTESLGVMSFARRLDTRVYGPEGLPILQAALDDDVELVGHAGRSPAQAGPELAADLELLWQTGRRASFLDWKGDGNTQLARGVERFERALALLPGSETELLATVAKGVLDLGLHPAIGAAGRVRDHALSDAIRSTAPHFPGATAALLSLPGKIGLADEHGAASR